MEMEYNILVKKSAVCSLQSASVAHRSTSRVVRSNELDFVEYRFSDHETKEKSSGC